MDQVICLGCGRLFTPRNKKQNYCSEKVCQNARKADWNKLKLMSDPDYKRNRKISNNKWLSANPDYWRKYRAKNPEKTERNRVLQRLRNKRQKGMIASDIAKTDARKPPSKTVISIGSGQFWIVPVIAKTDAAKVFLRIISTHY